MHMIQELRQFLRDSGSEQRFYSFINVYNMRFQIDPTQKQDHIEYDRLQGIGHGTIQGQLERIQRLGTDFIGWKHTSGPDRSGLIHHVPLILIRSDIVRTYCVQCKEITLICWMKACRLPMPALQETIFEVARQVQ